ncbi:N-acetyl-L,L-diaminopimelate deacetylase -like protein [Bacillus subtilis subsp. subtilis]|uniref:N-acetyl-L,L-diaminopimelate deacetylase-like protein n=1 Tax=Bacillus subtilis subsp. subtilis TaxID=135461 RepID=A0ABD3ZXP3_BACIU|nr:N-acetyl-L,L-diaminopimelate deacetylase -like protein [Bacillus subtilis subsp. subtilis]MCB4341834.1 putative hydrolase YxeP [Bacillus subtilis]PLV32988.1 putative hydrolase YxeP [Bacillus subtilis subsp. subtilis]
MSLDYWRNIEGSYPYQTTGNDILKLKGEYNPVNLSTLEKQLIGIRRHLHQYPELSKEEFETTAFIKKCLKEKGIQIRPTALKTGVFADIAGESEGPAIALRADIDALPIEEKTGLPYASKHKGIMHACGHDFHTAALLGAAFLLKENQDSLKGKVRLLFQPAEEAGAGAAKVIEDGQLDGIDAVIGLHNKPDIAVGTVGLKTGPLMAAVDRFKVEIEGKGAHAALPHNGFDPIVGASQLIVALQTIVSRNVNPLQSAILTVGKINGGSTWNVIPDTVVIEGTVRTFDSEVRNQVKQRFLAVTEQISAAFSLKANVKWHSGPPPLCNDEAITGWCETLRIKRNFKSLIPPHQPRGKILLIILSIFRDPLRFLEQTVIMIGTTLHLQLMKLPLSKPLIFYMKAPRDC